MTRKMAITERAIVSREYTDELGRCEFRIIAVVVRKLYDVLARIVTLECV
jgi:hypothetical protein